MGASMNSSSKEPIRTRVYSRQHLEIQYFQTKNAMMTEEILIYWTFLSSSSNYWGSLFAISYYHVHTTKTEAVFHFCDVRHDIELVWLKFDIPVWTLCRPYKHWFHHLPKESLSPHQNCKEKCKMYIKTKCYNCQNM